MFHRLGAAMFRARWAVIAAWAVVLVLAGLFAPRAPGVLKTDAFSLAVADSVQVTEALASRFGAGRTYLLPVFTLPKGADAHGADWAQKVDDALAPLRQDP